MHDKPVAVIGDALVDRVVAADGKTTDHPGGAGLNVAVGVSRLGGLAMIAYPVVEDDEGQTLATFLRSEGVPRIALPAGDKTGIATSRVVDGEAVYEFSTAITERRYEYPPATAQVLMGCRALVVSSFPFGSKQDVDRLVALASGLGCPVAVDANVRPTLLSDVSAYRDGFERVAAMASVVKVSRDDLDLLYGSSDISPLLGLLGSGPDAVIETLGSAGARLHSRFGMTSAQPPALDSPVVSTMGAGDALLARVALDLGSVRTPKDLDSWHALLVQAVAVAAATCLYPGALLPAPSQSVRS